MRYFLAILALIFVTTVTPALAGHPGGGGGGRPGPMHGPMHGPAMGGGRPHMRLDHIIGGIRRHHPGRLSDVRTFPGPHGEPHYRVKWLTPEGRVLWLDVDPETGQVMNVEGQDR